MSNEVNNNSAGDYEEYEEINEIEEVDDSGEYAEPIIEYEDDGYDENGEYVEDEDYYDDEYAEDEGYDEDEEYAEDEGYDDEEAYDEEEYDDDNALVPAENDGRMNQLLAELEAMRNTNLYHNGQGHGVLHAYGLSEISRLRDETLKNNLQNQITYNNSIFNEIHRLKDDVTRNQADTKLHYEIMQLRQELKNAQAAAAPMHLHQGGGGSGTANDEYQRDKLRNEIKEEIYALKEELKSERAERTARQDIDRLKAQIAQLQKGGGGKSGFNTGEETAGTSHPSAYNNPGNTNYSQSSAMSAGDFERILREIKLLKDDFYSKIEEIRGQNERVISVSRELAGKVEEIRSSSVNAAEVVSAVNSVQEKASQNAAEARGLLNEILEELDIATKASEAKAAIADPVNETINTQFEEIKSELKELSEMMALVKAASLAPSEVKKTVDDLSIRVESLEDDMDGVLADGQEQENAVPKTATMLSETLSGLSAQLDSLTQRLGEISEGQVKHQNALDMLAAAQSDVARLAEERAKEAERVAAEAKAADAEAARTFALEAAHEAAEQAARATAAQTAQATQQSAIAELNNLSDSINNLRTEILSVTNDQSQAITQYMQYFANEVTNLKTEIKSDMDDKIQSVNTAIRTVSEPRVQQASAGLDNDTAEALNAVLNDIKLNIVQNQDAVNRSLQQQLEYIKTLLSDRSDAAAAAVDRAALLEAVNELRSAMYDNMNETEGGVTAENEVTANDISEILNEINLLRQDVVRQSVESNTVPGNDNSLFLEQFGAAVMQDFDYLKEEVRQLGAVDQAATLQALIDEFNALKVQLEVSQSASAGTDAVLAEIEQLKSVITEQNSIADAQASESASQAEAIAAIREAIASLPDELRLTVAGAVPASDTVLYEQLTQEIGELKAMIEERSQEEQLTQEIAVLKAMIEEQSRHIPSTEALDNLAGQINSIRMLIGENPALASDYTALNNLSNEIGSLRAMMETTGSHEMPSEALENLANEIGEVKALLESREGNEMYVEFTAAMEELRGELNALNERSEENYREILAAANAALAAAEQAAEVTAQPTEGSFDGTAINENLVALRDELSNRLVPDTFVIMDSLKDFRSELEANLAARDAEKTELITGQLAQLGRDVYEYTAPGKQEIDPEFSEYIKKELKTAKDAVLYSIYRDNVYSAHMTEDLAYLGDQLYYLSEDLASGFSMTADPAKNKELLQEITRYIDTLRHDMTNRVMQDADAFNNVSDTLKGLQNELRAIQSDNNKAIAALNKENAATLKETVSGLKSEFKETYTALRLDHNTVLSNILNTLKSLRSDLISEVAKGREIDDRRVLQELSTIKGEIAAARSKGLAVTEKSVTGAVTIEDLKNELSGIAEIVKSNKKTKTTTTTSTRKSSASSPRKASSSSRGGSSGRSTRTKSLSSSKTTEVNKDGQEELVEATVTTTETVNDAESISSTTNHQSQTSYMTAAQINEMSTAAELNEIYEYDGQRYTREQLQLAQALAAKIADRMIVDKLAEQLDSPTILTIAEEMIKNRNDDKKEDDKK